MKPWEIWDCSFPGGEHPSVIISNALRVELKAQIVVLACSTMRAETVRDPVGCEVLLDEADGLNWKTALPLRSLLYNRQDSSEKKTWPGGYAAPP